MQRKRENERRIMFSSLFSVFRSIVSIFLKSNLIRNEQFLVTSFCFPFILFLFTLHSTLSAIFSMIYFFRRYFVSTLFVGSTCFFLFFYIYICDFVLVGNGIFSLFIIHISIGEVHDGYSFF